MMVEVALEYGERQHGEREKKDNQFIVIVIVVEIR